MRATRWIALAALGAAAAGGACGDDEAPGGPGGGGGSGGCTAASECPAPSGECEVAACEAGVCGSALAPAGTACGQSGACDAAGTCLKGNGEACAGPTECGSGACVDGVCCAGPCDGKCMACDVAGSEGTCAPVPFPLDPDMECPVEGSCNGQGECSGAVLGLAGYGGTDSDSAYGLATSSDGSVRLTGFYSAPISFGGATLPLAGLADAFIASFDNDLTHRWSDDLGSPSTDVGVVETGVDVAVDAAGNTLMAMLLKGQADLGGGPLGADGETHAALVKLGPDGSHVWSKDLGRNCEGRARVATGPGDRVVVVTCYEGTVDFGGGPTTGMQSTQFATVSYTAGGAFEWQVLYGTGMDQPAGVAMDPAGNAYIGATLMFAYDFGGGTLAPQGQMDGVIIKLDAAGGHVWSRRYGGADAEPLGSLAASADGLVVSGTFGATVDFGGGPLVADAGDAYVLRLDADGNHVWSRKVGGPSTDSAVVAFDPQGNVLVTGTVNGNADFAGMESPGGQFDYDVFAGKIAADGAPMWIRRYTTMGWGYDIASDPAGNVFATGWFNDDFDGLLTGAGSYDVFLIKLAP